ncbi:MAG: response regulator [Candidatus Rokuibacteriota bacterium]
MRPRDETPRASLFGIHVLLVEDEPDCLELLRAVLEYCGALVTGTLSADEALSVMRRVKPDVLVSDVMMPEHDGYWLIRQVRALSAEDGGEIPAVVVTALAYPTDRERVLSEGFQAHLTKPIDPWTLCRVVWGLVKRP